MFARVTSEVVVKRIGCRFLREQVRSGLHFVAYKYSSWLVGFLYRYDLSIRVVYITRQFKIFLRFSSVEIVVTAI